jgi:hypothetical protein
VQQPPRGADVNVFAVASLVLGILGFVELPFAGAVLAMVLGWVARRQIAVSGDTGLRLARAGSILGASWFVVALLAVLLVINTHPR